MVERWNSAWLRITSAVTGSLTIGLLQNGRMETANDSQMICRRFRCAALLLFAIAVPAFAQMSWNGRMIESTAALKAGDYQKALRIDDDVIKQMLGTLAGGDEASRVFGIALTHRALALAGLGRNEDAIWTWHEALAVRPALASSDISEYGAPAAFLLANLPPKDFSAPKVEGDVKAPVSERRVEPLFPGGARSGHLGGITVVESVIDRTGKVRDVRVTEATAAPTITYAVMEAFRHWTFRPGTLNGQPIDVRYHLTVNMRCP